MRNNNYQNLSRLIFKRYISCSCYMYTIESAEGFGEHLLIIVTQEPRIMETQSLHEWKLTFTDWISSQGLLLLLEAGHPHSFFTWPLLPSNQEQYVPKFELLWFLLLPPSRYTSLLLRTYSIKSGLPVIYFP